MMPNATPAGHRAAPPIPVRQVLQAARADAAATISMHLGYAVGTERFATIFVVAAAAQIRADLLHR